MTRTDNYSSRPAAKDSTVGSVTTLSNLLRMLYSRAGDYPRSQPLLYAESFSPNTPESACPQCHGLGRIYEVTERSMVPDDTLSISSLRPNCNRLSGGARRACLRLNCCPCLMAGVE